MTINEKAFFVINKLSTSVNIFVAKKVTWL